MYLGVIFIVKKALHVLVTSSLVDFTSWVVGCCCSHCKDYSRESCADHTSGDSRGVPLSQVRPLAVGRGRWRAREPLEGRGWWWGSGPGSWLDASPLAPSLPCTLAAEDSPRLHRNSWLPHLGEGNIDGNLSTLALKEKQQSLSPGVSGKVTSTLSVPWLPGGHQQAGLTPSLWPFRFWRKKSCLQKTGVRGPGSWEAVGTALLGPSLQPSLCPALRVLRLRTVLHGAGTPADLQTLSRASAHLGALRLPFPPAPSWLWAASWTRGQDGSMEVRQCTARHEGGGITDLGHQH